MEYFLLLEWFGHVSIQDYGLTLEDCQALMAEVIYVNDGLGVYTCAVEA